MNTITIRYPLADGGTLTLAVETPDPVDKPLLDRLTVVASAIEGQFGPFDSEEAS